MKKLIVIFLSISILGCNKDELPKETKEGEDTFGMLVEGVEWIPYNPSEIGPGDNKPYSVYYSGCGTIEIYAYGEGFIYFTAQIKDTGTYLINKCFPQIDNCLHDSIYTTISETDSYKTKFQVSTNSDSIYVLTDSLNSRLKITAFDTEKQLISGKFEMTLCNKNNEKLQITNGIFDINYKNF